MPRALAIARFALLEYPLSPIAARGTMSGPMSSNVWKCVQSEACPPVRSKAIRAPQPSALAWILVVNPPRDRPRAWPFCPLLPQPLTHGRAQSWNQTSGSDAQTGSSMPACRKRLQKNLPCSTTQTASTHCSTSHIPSEAPASVHSPP